MNNKIMSTPQQAVKEKTEATDYFKSEFLVNMGNMSHELLTPLHTVIGFSDELADLENLRTLTEDEVLEFAGYIHQAGYRLLALISDLLDLSRIEAGYLALNKEKFYLKDVCLKLEPILRQQAESKGLSLRFEGDDPIILADYHRVSQVIMNLVDNAIKFTERGGVTVRISTAETEAVVSVIDTGIGISEPNLQMIFKKFRQVDGSASRQKGGTGLGLAISRSLVEMHGGRIWAESKPGRGSSFSFAIPIGQMCLAEE